MDGQASAGAYDRRYARPRWRNSTKPAGADITYTYTEFLELNTEAVTGPYSRTIDRDYAANTIGRLTQLSAATTAGTDYAASYDYESATGRMQRVRGPGLPAGTGDRGAWYNYLQDGQGAWHSDLVASMTVRSDSEERLLVSRTHESQRDVLLSVAGTWRPAES